MIVGVEVAMVGLVVGDRAMRFVLSEVAEVGMVSEWLLGKLGAVSVGWRTPGVV